MHANATSLFKRLAGCHADLLDVDLGAENYDVNVRQPSNQICAAYADDTSNPRASVAWSESLDPFVNCDVRQLLDGAFDPDPATQPPGWWPFYLLRFTYDKDGDSTITPDEFMNGLSSMTCCGTVCPFASWCERHRACDAFAMVLTDARPGVALGVRRSSIWWGLALGSTTV